MSRVHHPESRIEIEASPGHDAFECEDAEIWIEGRRMLVSYFDDDGIVVLEGHLDPEGSWILAARSRPRRAFLTPMSEAPGVYVGEIEEQGEGTVWRIRLGESIATDP